MQVEVQVPNHEGKLYAGMYGQVRFLLPDDNAPVVVPADAFVFRAQGPQVVTVTNENQIHWQKIRVGRDFGTQLEVLDGLNENTKVVMNPSDELVEGIQFQVPGRRTTKFQSGRGDARSFINSCAGEKVNSPSCVCRPAFQAPV